MTNERVKIILEDIEQSMQYKFLETASDRSEIESIARKRGLIVPSSDIALFKGKYTRAGVFNRNGSRIKKVDLEKGLGTLTLKPITLNHREKQIIGIWLDAYMDGDDVIAYGAIFKDNYGDQFAKFKANFQNGDIGISYELYGNKIKVSDGKYDFQEISFCGGALLDKGIKPAVPGSKVLEFAMVKEVGISNELLTACDKCGFKFDSSTVKAEEGGGIKCPQCKEIIGMNASTAETSEIPCNCPVCGNRNWKDVVDNEANKILANCVSCGKSFAFEIEQVNNKIPKLGLTAVFEGRTNCLQCGEVIKYPVWSDCEKNPLTCKKCGLRFIHKKKEKSNKFIIKSITEVKMNDLQKTFASVEKEDDITEEMLSMYEEASEEIQNTLDEKIKELAKNKKISISESVKKAKEKAYEDAIKEIAESMGVDVEKVKELLNKKETASDRIDVLKNGIKKLALEVMNYREDTKIVSEYEKELASSKENHIKEIASIKEVNEKEIAQVKVDYEAKAIVICERKLELGDFAKDLNNEQLLDSKDYEIAKLKKELSEKKEKDSAAITPIKEMAVGTIDVPATDEKEIAQLEYNARVKEAAKLLREKRNAEALKLKKK